MPQRPDVWLLERRGKRMKKHIVTLQNEMFNEGDRFFNSVNECKEFIKFVERIYPNNKGMYKMYELKEVLKNESFR